MPTTMAHAMKEQAAASRRWPGVLAHGRRGRVAPERRRHRYGIAALALVVLTGFCFALKAPAASALANGRISMIHTYDDQYCLSADVTDSVPGGQVILLGCNGDDHYQQWLVTDITPSGWSAPGLRGFYVLRNVGSNLCLTGGSGDQFVVQDTCSWSNGELSNLKQFWTDWATPVPGISYFSQVRPSSCLQYDSSSEKYRSPVYQQPCSDLGAPLSKYPGQYWVEYTW